MTSDAWRGHANRLLDQLKARGLMSSAELERVFWEVPRHLFIDRMYEYEQSSYSWTLQEKPAFGEENDGWLAEIYQDRPLVVGIDDSGMPYCSNSAPCLVAQLLEFLALTPGDRVLEIGTGTGHLTALLGMLVKPAGEVLSVDIEPELARSADMRLRSAFSGIPVQVAVGDGRSWRRGSADRDAVVSTGSCWPVPDGWLESLAPGGRLCVELRGGLAGSVLRARRSGDAGRAGLVTGTFGGQQAGFMPLRASASGFSDPIALPLGFGIEAIEQAPAEGLGAAQLTQDFKWYCQLEIPDAKFIMTDTDETAHLTPYLIADDGLDGVMLPEDGVVAGSELVAYGDTSFLLDRVLSAWRGWHQKGCPGFGQYRFESPDPDQQLVILNGRDKTWKI
jgi:protein-L-isoaspartate O-methyltransferase